MTQYDINTIGHNLTSTLSDIVRWHRILDELSTWIHAILFINIQNNFEYIILVSVWFEFNQIILRKQQFFY